MNGFHTFPFCLIGTSCAHMGCEIYGSFMGSEIYGSFMGSQWMEKLLLERTTRPLSSPSIQRPPYFLYLSELWDTFDILRVTHRRFWHFTFSFLKHAPEQRKVSGYHSGVPIPTTPKLYLSDMSRSITKTCFPSVATSFYQLSSFGIPPAAM